MPFVLDNAFQILSVVQGLGGGLGEGAGVYGRVDKRKKTEDHRSRI